MEYYLGSELFVPVDTVSIMYCNSAVKNVQPFMVSSVVGDATLCATVSTCFCIASDWRRSGIRALCLSTLIISGGCWNLSTWTNCPKREWILWQTCCHQWTLSSLLTVISGGIECQWKCSRWELWLGHYCVSYGNILRNEIQMERFLTDAQKMIDGEGMGIEQSLPTAKSKLCTSLLNLGASRNSEKSACEWKLTKLVNHWNKFSM